MKEFRNLRIAKSTKEKLNYNKPIFLGISTKILLQQSQELSSTYKDVFKTSLQVGKLYSVGILFKIYQSIISFYLQDQNSTFFSRVSDLYDKNLNVAAMIEYFKAFYPNPEEVAPFLENEENIRAFFVYEVMKKNPALIEATGKLIFNDEQNLPSSEKGILALITGVGEKLPESFSKLPENGDLFSLLIKPAITHPNSLENQFLYIEKMWGSILDEDVLILLKRAKDILNEEEKPRFFGGPGEQKVPDFSKQHLGEVEAFSSDKEWMPNVIMMAKSTFVWLDQLSKKYNKDIKFLNQIPDSELDELQDRGFTSLWLIGLWQRSEASKKIKNLCGNPEAESSAYSLKNYIISDRIGGQAALEDLNQRCKTRKIRLACDMVPNHMGLDSDWMKEHEDYFVSQSYSPYPNYTYTGFNLSKDPEVEIRIEDHYYDQTDAAVTFQKINHKTGEIKYFFHGNDGTTMPWNDTAQLDFLNPNTREAVIQQILEVARKFHIIRFDAAMTLAKKHIQRLWYPQPGTGGDIPGRTVHGLSEEEFNQKIPEEFWREVVDRISEEVPDTLLLAEAFWMMEGYFVRTLGMHRVYNSAFMNMLKKEENKKYRDSIKATISFDPEILKRYVNFMNNPDEDTAIAQFGDSDRYFGVCTMLVTMPGLPMFGHGQIEGYREKYGMEYSKAYWDEKPNSKLIQEHYKRIFPLLKLRYLFSSSENFEFFDVLNGKEVQESVFVYSNGKDNHRTLVMFNNRYEKAEGYIYQAALKLCKENNCNRELKTTTIFESLLLYPQNNTFVLYRNFNDGLNYIKPSYEIQEKGIFLSLSGYETKVFLDIHQVEDQDGIYSQIYRKYQNRGFENLDKEIEYFTLLPFFNQLMTIKETSFKKNLKLLLQNKITIKNLSYFKEQLINLYKKEETFIDNLKAPKEEEIIKMVNKFKLICSKEVFQAGNTLIDNFEKIISIYLIITPLVNSETTLKEALLLVDKYRLNEFIECNLYSSHLSALLAVSGNYTIEELLNNEEFNLLIGTNSYQGVIWYKGESFQDCLYIYYFGKSLLEKRIFIKKTEKEIEYWLNKDCKSSYFLDNLKS
ncbi:MAG: alpha-amylase family glycosyl hydrolase [Sphaerochaetaceae bacterium]